VHNAGDSGEEVLYGTSDGHIGLVQLSRLSTLAIRTMCLME